MLSADVKRAGIALMVRIPYIRFIPVSSVDFLNQAKYQLALPDKCRDWLMTE